MALPVSTQIARSRSRGLIWWFGLSLIVLVGLIAAGFVWAHFTVWHVSAADRNAAVRSVEKAAGSSSTGSTCLHSDGTITCVVTTRESSKCQTWSVQLRRGELVGRPRWVATTAC